MGIHPERQLQLCLQVPSPIGNPDEVAFIGITVLEASSEYQKKQKVLIKHADKKTFIQTDKPVYKPGQIGMGRMHVLWEKRAVLRPQNIG